MCKIVIDFGARFWYYISIKMRVGASCGLIRKPSTILEGRNKMSHFVTIDFANPVTNEVVKLHIEEWSEGSRYGFNHKARCREYPQVGVVKIHYINRTWEAFPFQCVRAKLVRQIEHTERSAERHKREAERKAREERQRVNVVQLELF